MSAAKISTKHDGNLVIRTPEDARRYAHIEEVTGYLYVRADFKAPLLATVGGHLYVRADFKAPLLTTVGGSLYVYADFKAPLLTTVGGSLDVYADFKAPLLTTVGGSLDVDADFKAPQLATAHGKPGRLVAVSKYGLWLAADGMYYAGCRGPLTKEQALTHWDRTDKRAIIFTAAIRGTR